MRIKLMATMFAKNKLYSYVLEIPPSLFFFSPTSCCWRCSLHTPASHLPPVLGGINHSLQSFQDFLENTAWKPQDSHEDDLRVALQLQLCVCCDCYFVFWVFFFLAPPPDFLFTFRKEKHHYYF